MQLLLGSGISFILSLAFIFTCPCRPVKIACLFMLLLAGTATFLVAGVLIFGSLTHLPVWHVWVPKEPARCSANWLEVPVLFPVHAGSDLTTSQMNHRQDYFVSLLLYLLLSPIDGLLHLASSSRTWEMPTGPRDAQGMTGWIVEIRRTLCRRTLRRSHFGSVWHYTFFRHV